MNPGFEIAVTLKGTSIQDIVEQAKALIEADGAAAVTTATTGKRGKKAAAAVETDTDLDDLNGEAQETETTDEIESFDEVEETPAAPAKSAKITDKQVNTAAMNHAKKFGRPATMKILAGKFKVKSILELKPEQYGKVIAALKV